MGKAFAVTILYVLVVAGIAACNKVGRFFDPALGLHVPRIAISSQATGVNVVALYDLSGKLITRATDYNSNAEIPRGLLALDNNTLLAVIDGTDRLEKIYSDLTTSTFASNTNFNGTLGGIATDSSGNFYVIEGNTVEKFGADGDRIPVTSASPYIATTVGSCTLNNPHALVVLSNGYLAVTSAGNSRLNVYDISTSTASCYGSYSAAPYSGNTPRPIIQHSNGYIYIGMAAASADTIVQVDSTYTNATTIWAQQSTIIQTPFAIAELPDGNLLVAGSGTDSIEKITVTGTRVGSTPFIKDSFTSDVRSIVILEGN